MNFSIIEDGYYSELYFTPLPPATLFTMASDLPSNRRVSVFYFSSFSTILHPNLRIGYLVIPPEWAKRFQYARDTTTSLVSQQLLLQLWETIQLPEYLAQLRKKLCYARNRMIESLEEWIPQGYTYSYPQMGVSGWVYAPAAFNGLDFFERCLAEHVFVMPDEAFAAEDPVPGFQVKFGHIPPQMLDEGIKRIGRVLQSNFRTSRQ
ncbi:aminotransferase class I/II-fold pyridoxal phosphate-dependent enzyme [Paenactinomyces guangxiensis]|uniref:Aminotransferase class I/II-fold pyridoxal phosphate-dependent enzyme n=1 Tax=Paenactinomyces guangxiensis TaxID=1490290 RepID=A0A7W2A9H1_9BACL|nr:aminotransferase class I/II-fold pyridoxal phosphate-dependent enzyme [Paenactinomyces guangxiensis]MBA4494898.1 aminotransferase class I/II-fold pyridoxal phosphate-dependent enzyme [Paenactinomyces guangxiensis]MBH8591981.1 aminotransferase class I/II-fold pyridoxal phosphate-dependent enzyme [Paenactinomyces guangxiensis]